MHSTRPRGIRPPIKHPSRDCLVVADAILRLLDSLHDGDLPDDVREMYDEVSSSVFGFVCASKRWEQEDEAFRARAADMFVWAKQAEASR